MTDDYERRQNRNRMTRAAYQGLIDEDLAWLDAQPKSLERDHIRLIVARSPEREYGSEEAETKRRSVTCQRLGCGAVLKRDDGIYCDLHPDQRHPAKHR